MFRDTGIRVVRESLWLELWLCAFQKSFQPEDFE